MFYKLLSRLQGKRKRESDDEAGRSPSRTLPSDSLKKSSVPILSTTAVLPPSALSPSEPSPASAQVVQIPVNTLSLAPCPISDGPNRGLTTLYEPENPRSAIVDIVFVHGLTGNAYTTWLYNHGKTKVYWPYDLLQKDLPDARILAFGYDADITSFWGPASSNRVGNHAEDMLGDLSHLRASTDTEHRKLIFVMHSLGGLVTQYALNLSNCSPEVDIQSIEKHTVGLAFLGTPHHGSDHAGWLSFATSLTGCLKKMNQEIIACLKPQSEVLAMIQKGFHTLLSKRNDAGSKIAVTCFPEQLPVTLVGHIVPYHSAILPQYPSYGIWANHKNMGKFDSAQHAGYKRVVGEISRWVKLLHSGHQQTYPDNLNEDFLQSLDVQDVSNPQNSIHAAYTHNSDLTSSSLNDPSKPWPDSRSHTSLIANKSTSREPTIMRRLADTPDEQLSVCQGPDGKSNLHKDSSSLRGIRHKSLKNDLDKSFQSAPLRRRHHCSYSDCDNHNGRGFSALSNLDRHIKIVHQGLAYHCSFSGCDNNNGRGFSSSDYLKEHVVSHQGRKYNCSFSGCNNNKGKGFSVGRCLNQHINLVHQDPR
ncbi:Alpha/Beta hydrolase fold [Hyaloscypha variabilis]